MIQCDCLPPHYAPSVPLLVCTAQPSSAQLRIEVHPVETVTLSTQEFLTGSQNGKPTTLAAELRVPKPGKVPLKFPQAQTARNCLFSEGDAGQIVNRKTGVPFTLNDPCIEKGTTVASNEAATTATTKAVKELLTALPPVAMKN